MGPRKLSQEEKDEFLNELLKKMGVTNDQMSKDEKNQILEKTKELLEKRDIKMDTKGQIKDNITEIKSAVKDTMVLHTANKLGIPVPNKDLFDKKHEDLTVAEKNDKKTATETIMNEFQKDLKAKSPTPKPTGKKSGGKSSSGDEIEGVAEVITNEGGDPLAYTGAIASGAKSDTNKGHISLTDIAASGAIGSFGAVFESVMQKEIDKKDGDQLTENLSSGPKLTPPGINQ